MDLFLKSPYFNTSVKTYNLFCELIKYFPDFDNGELTKHNLSVNSSLSGKYNESTLRDSLSGLLKLSLRFLSINSYESRELETANRLLNELLNRKAFRLFEKYMKHYDEKFNNPKNIDSKYVYERYCFKTSVFNYKMLNSKILHKPEAVNKLNELSSISYDLNNFYISELVALYLNSKILTDKYNINSDAGPVSSIYKNLNIKSFLNVHKDENQNFILLYKHLINAYDNIENESYYLKYRKFLKQNLGLISLDEIAFHYYWLINYCIIRKKSDLNKEFFDKELMRVYMEILQNKYYLDRKNKYLSSDLYRDILLHGIHLKNYKWVREFIEKYHEEIKPDERENILNYSYTYLYCTLRDFNKALKYYKNIVMDKFIFKYDIKNIVLKMYYEIKYFEEAIFEIKSYREFLRNNAMVTESRKTRLGNFLKYFEKLIKFNYDFDRDELGFCLKKLLKEQNVAFKEWILEKMVELLAEKATT